MSSILDQLNDLPAPDSGQPNESQASMPPPTQLPPIQSNARRQRKKRRTKAPAPDSTSDTAQLVQESPRSVDTLSPRPIDASPQEQVNESFQMTEDVPPLMKQSSKSVRFDETLERTEYLNYPDSATHSGASCKAMHSGACCHEVNFPKSFACVFWCLFRYGIYL